MATRLYLRDTTVNSASAPSAEQSSTLPNGSVSSPTFATRDLSTTKGAAAPSLTHTHPSESGVHRDGMNRLWVSDALAAGTLSANTWSTALRRNESNTNADCYDNGCLYVWRPTSSAVVGYIYNAHDGALGGFTGGAEYGTVAATNFPTVAGSAVTVQSGDRIVFEWWTHWLHLMAVAYTHSIYWDGSVDDGAGGTHTACYVETPQDSLFGGAAAEVIPDLVMARS